jgi:hypothetical protein
VKFEFEFSGGGTPLVKEKHMKIFNYEENTYPEW